MWIKNMNKIDKYLDVSAQNLHIQTIYVARTIV